MLYAIVAVLALIVDQLVKYWTTVKIVVDTGEAKLIPGFIHLANVHNTGAAFSFLEGARWFFVVLCILFVAVVVYVLVRNIVRQPLARWMAVLVMAGAIGNCIDRIVCGYVVDMFEFEFMRFPVFNVADIYITVGAVIFCVCILLEKPAKKTAAPSAATKTAAPAAAAKPAPAPAKKPLLRKHKKVEVPDFPKRAPAPAAPAIDPNDPFAEWEKRAAEKPTPAPAPQQPQQPQPTRVVYSQPAPQQPTPAPQPAAPAHHAAAHHEPPQHAAHHEAPAAPAPQQPAAPAQPAVPAADSAEFDLDSILAEFKDL